MPRGVAVWKNDAPHRRIQWPPRGCADAACEGGGAGETRQCELPARVACVLSVAGGGRPLRARALAISRSLLSLTPVPERPHGIAPFRGRGSGVHRASADRGGGKCPRRKHGGAPACPVRVCGAVRVTDAGCHCDPHETDWLDTSSLVKEQGGSGGTRRGWGKCGGHRHGEPRLSF